MLLPLGIEVTEAAQPLGMSRATVSRVINGRRGISSDPAVRLERVGVNTARFWMTSQSNHGPSQVERRMRPTVQRLQEVAQDPCAACPPWRDRLHVPLRCLEPRHRPGPACGPSLIRVP